MAIINSFVIWRMKKRFHQIELFLKYPHEVQKDSLITLLKTAENTEWGKRYDFKSINTYETFKSRIKLQDYNSTFLDLFSSIAILASCFILNNLTHLLLRSVFCHLFGISTKEYS